MVKSYVDHDGIFAFRKLRVPNIVGCGVLRGIAANLSTDGHLEGSGSELIGLLLPSGCISKLDGGRQRRDYCVYVEVSGATTTGTLLGLSEIQDAVACTRIGAAWRVLFSKHLLCRTWDLGRLVFHTEKRKHQRVDHVLSISPTKKAHQRVDHVFFSFFRKKESTRRPRFACSFNKNSIVDHLLLAEKGTSTHEQ